MQRQVSARDAEKGQLHDLPEEDEDSSTEAMSPPMSPRMFQTVESDLLPVATGSVRQRKLSTVAVQRMKDSQSNLGLPSNLAKIRRRSSVHRPAMQTNRDVFTFQPQELERLDSQVKMVDEEEFRRGQFEDKEAEVPMLPVTDIADEDGLRFAVPRDKAPDSTPPGTDDEADEEEETYRFGGPLTVSDVKEEFGGALSLRALKRKLPILNWLPKYSKADFFGDLVAGLTVGLTVVPQCLAYAVIADIKLEYGLNSAYIGCFIYALMGTSKDVTVGPTAIVSLLTGAFVRRDIGEVGDWAVLLCFFVGCFQLLMGFLRLGFLINFISAPVVSGFTQAAVVVIILSQVKNMMGVRFGASTDNVPQTLAGYWRMTPKVNGWDVLMGVFCISLLLTMKELKLPDRKVAKGDKPSKIYAALKETVRLISVSRYAIVVVMATAFVFLLEFYDIKVLSATGKVNAGLPMPKPPNFNVGGLSFGEILSSFGAGLVLVPLLATMESIAVAKTFAHKFRYNIYTTQEFLALGTANLVSSFFGAYPVTGAFTRSALNAESGVRTPAGGIITGSFVIIAIVALGPMLQYIPKAALAAVIICACLTMFDFQIIRELYYIRRSELFCLILTCVACLLFRVDIGLIVGLTVSILMLVYPMARPVVIVSQKKPNPQVAKIPILDDFKITVTPKGAIFFPAAEYVKGVFNDSLFSQTVKAYTNRQFLVAQPGGLIKRKFSTKMEMLDALPPIVFDGIHLTSSDYSTLRALRAVVVNCKSVGREITFVNTSSDILNIIDPEGRTKEKKDKNIRKRFSLKDKLRKTIGAKTP